MEHSNSLLERQISLDKFHYTHHIHVVIWLCACSKPNYRIAGNVGGEFNLADLRIFVRAPPN